MFAFQDSDVSVRRTALETYLLRVYRAHSTHSLEYSEEARSSSLSISIDWLYQSAIFVCNQQTSVYRSLSVRVVSSTNMHVLCCGCIGRDLVCPLDLLSTRNQRLGRSTAKGLHGAFRDILCSCYVAILITPIFAYRV